MSMKTLANCAKTLERVQQGRQFGVSAFAGKNGNDGIKMSLNKLHVTAQQSYPVAVALPLPANIDPSETTRFSPQRARDITANAILAHPSSSLQKRMDITLDNSSTDAHVNSYDCTGAVSLNSSMQSNVPSPFGGMHKFTHLNMPGGQWGQDSKFMSQNLQNSHYTNLRREARAVWSKYDENATLKNKGTTQTKRNQFYSQAILGHNQRLCNLHELTQSFSTTSNDNKTVLKKPLEQEKPNQVPCNDDDHKESRKEKLKRAVKEYGATVIVFHVGISLVSLGVSYLVVSRGIDVLPLLEAVGLGSSALSNNVAAGASTFVIAYAIHKIFAPVRISVTLGATPFIVKYLRSKGILKVKVKKE